MLHVYSCVNQVLQNQETSLSQVEKKKEREHAESHLHVNRPQGITCEGGLGFLMLL